MGSMSADMQSQEALLKILEEVNIADLFRSPQNRDSLFQTITKFGEEYAQHLGGAKAGLPSTASLDDLLTEHARNPYRVHMLLEALAFHCSPEILAMVWMTLLGARIEELSYSYVHEKSSTLEATLLLPDRRTRLSFQSPSHWDAAVMRFASLAKSDGKPVIDGFFPIVIPRKGTAPARPSKS